MTASKRRNRIVSFRVSDDEYAELARLSAEHGARNIGDFTRSAAYRLAPLARRSSSSGNVFDLVQHLDALVFEISELIRELRPAAPAEEQENEAAAVEPAVDKASG